MAGRKYPQKVPLNRENRYREILKLGSTIAADANGNARSMWRHLMVKDVIVAEGMFLPF